MSSTDKRNSKSLFVKPTEKDRIARKRGGSEVDGGKKHYKRQFGFSSFESGLFESGLEEFGKQVKNSIGKEGKRFARSYRVSPNPKRKIKGYHEHASTSLVRDTYKTFIEIDKNFALGFMQGTTGGRSPTNSLLIREEGGQGHPGGFSKTKGSNSWLAKKHGTADKLIHKRTKEAIQFGVKMLNEMKGKDGKFHFNAETFKSIGKNIGMMARVSGAQATLESMTIPEDQVQKRLKTIRKENKKAVLKSVEVDGKMKEVRVKGHTKQLKKIFIDERMNVEKQINHLPFFRLKKEKK